jgi:hypothetical protein
VLVEAYFLRQRMRSGLGPFFELLVEGGVNQARRAAELLRDILERRVVLAGPC